VLFDDDSYDPSARNKNRGYNHRSLFLDGTVVNLNVIKIHGVCLLVCETTKQRLEKARDTSVLAPFRARPWHRCARRPDKAEPLLLLEEVAHTCQARRSASTLSETVRVEDEADDSRLPGSFPHRIRGFRTAFNAPQEQDGFS
jgi:hypothetical protein